MSKAEVIEGLYQAESSEAGQMLRYYLREQVRGAVLEIVEEEISSLCGTKHHPKSESPFSRAGSSPSKVYCQGKPEAMNRPRVRRQKTDGSSVEEHLDVILRLKMYHLFALQNVPPRGCHNGLVFGG